MGSGRRLDLAVGVATLVALGIVMCAAPFVSAAVPTPARCNGVVELCDRPLGEVAFATTHNSMASSADRFRPAEPA